MADRTGFCLKMDTTGIDILIERCNEFSCGGKVYKIYPPSIGVTMMTKGAVERLNLDQALVNANPMAAFLEAAGRDPKQCCRIIALATCKGKDEAMSSATIDRKTRHLVKSLDTEEIASLLIEVLDNNKASQFITESGIEKELDNMRRVAKCKKNDTPSFGGVTIFGQLIDPAMERYGWTYDYTVWGISYAALTIILADKVTQVFLTEEERKKAPAHLLDNGPKFSADNPQELEKFIAMS